MRRPASDAAFVPRNALLKLSPWLYLNHDKFSWNEGLDK